MPTNSSEYQKEYYQNNRKKVLAQIAEPIQCECGRVIVKGNISKHQRSTIHNKLMVEIEKEKKVKEYDLLLKKYNKLKQKLK